METLRLQLSSSNIDSDPALLQAAEILRSGGLVAFPTETVYGLGANALDPSAVEKIFAAKQRPHWDPVIVHVSSIEQARTLATVFPDEIEQLAAAFWPGPLTVLLPRSPLTPSVCTAGREKVGLRMPAHPVAKALIAAAAVPIAAPSANRFGHTSPTTAAHVLADLDGRIDAILDAGAADIGVESTVLDPLTSPPTIYRPGGVTLEQIRRLLPNVAIAERKISDETPPESLESPGLGIRHYAPRARVILVESQAELDTIVTRESSRRLGVLLPSGWKAPVEAAVILPWGDWNSPESLARDLYRQMRALDAHCVEIMIIPMPPAVGIGLAIRDRLRKAAK